MISSVLQELISLFLCILNKCDIYSSEAKCSDFAMSQQSSSTDQREPLGKRVTTYAIQQTKHDTISLNINKCSCYTYTLIMVNIVTNYNSLLKGL